MEEKKSLRKPRRYIANPLFEKWLIEWYEAAKDNGNPAQYSLAKAYKSMSKCPLRFETGKDCFILEHFSETLCQLIDTKLKKHNDQENIQQDLHNLGSSSSNPGKENVETNYVDEFDSGNKNTSTVNISTNLQEFPIILENKLQSNMIMTALYEAKQSNPSGFVTMKQLQGFVSEICKDSSDADETLQRFGSVLSDLISHKFVSKMSCPVRYGLTELGVSVIEAEKIDNRKAKKKLLKRKEEEKTKKKKEEDISKQKKDEEEQLKKIQENLKKKKDEEVQLKKKKEEEEKLKRKNEGAKLKRKKEDDEEGKSSKMEGTGEIEHSEQFILEPYSFDIILLVDVHETNAKSKDGNETTARLNHLNTRFSVQHLNVGDFAWIARCRRTQTELTLPYVVERKRVDDLSSSIKDGRFHEQKFRLKRSGIKNIIYLVEGLNAKAQTGIPITSLQQAATNSLVQDGFSLKYTDNHKDTILYLSNLTKVLYDQYKNKRLISCKKSDLDSMVDTEKTKYLMLFEEFNKTSSKNKVLRVQEMFVRQLAQLKGLSIDKALAITNLYPTPSLLQQALLKSGENSLVNIKVNNRKIGDNIGQAIHQLYTNDILK